MQNRIAHIKNLAAALLLMILLVMLKPGITAKAGPLEAAANLATIQHTVIPHRDPVDLAKRLLGLNGAVVPPAQAPTHSIGDEASFYVENTDTRTLETIQARLWYITPHVTMWFQDGFTPDLDALKRTTENFESHIYPTVHQYFGSEAQPGIDGDPHLYILHTRDVGRNILGYFSPTSEYSHTIEPSSNEHKLFFVNLDTLGSQLGSTQYNAVLSHEFQHMVEANIHPGQEAWLNEGFSELSASLNGYLDVGSGPDFLINSATQLNSWPVDLSQVTAHYGASYLFSSYLFQRLGEEAPKAILAQKANGLTAIRNVLSQTQPSLTLEDLFADWTTANLINDPTLGDGGYGYARIKTALPKPLTSALLPGDQPQAATATEWGTTYVGITNAGRYTLSFRGDPTVKVVSMAPHSGVKAWWSNRGDDDDMRLTHAFDLTGVQKATLNFWLWYAIEKEWDYGYVEVSTDDGATWKTLASTHAIPAGGHDNPYGPGYTGYSGLALNDSNASAATAQWEQESVDLTPYAGKQIQIRFEYMTDVTTNDEGMLIDDISIPEINYFTDAESGDDGWTAEGWARIENVLPQTYLIQKIEFGETGTAPRVTRLLGPSDGNTGSWSFEVGNGVTHTVISLSGLTEFTTQKVPFQYTFTLNP